MGYTHYWTLSKPRGVTAKNLEATYQKAIKACAKVVKAYNNGPIPREYRLSGYTAHTPIGAYGGLNVNGREDLAHETFIMREHFGEESFAFCKTARKPYNIVVVACLAILKYYLKDAIEVSSDGDALDFKDGASLASRILKRKIRIPIKGDI